MKSFSDKSVRDHTQRAIIQGDNIVISHCVGRKVCGKTLIPIKDWEYTYKGPSFNPNYNQAELMRRLTEDMDYQDGGPCQADRIRDSMIRAIKGIFMANTI